MRFARLLRITLDPMLDTALLDEFERILVTRGGLIAKHLRPGASESQLDAVADQLGTPLPDEARLWWSWHDGADPPRPGAAAAMLGPGRPFLPLARAITDTLQAREILSWNPDDLIHQCIVIDGGSDPAVAEIAGPATAPCPVWNLRFEYPTQASAGLTSLEALVRGWGRGLRDRRMGLERPRRHLGSVLKRESWPLRAGTTHP